MTAIAPPPTRSGTTRRLTYVEALVDAIAIEMRRDERVFYVGQDVGRFGGSMQGTQGLYEEFGARVREAPISEAAMVGAAVGAALFGRRPIVEISFGEFLPAAMNQLINQAPNIRYMTGGVGRVPLVVRTRVGDGPYKGHPQDYSAWFAHVPGLKVVMPATPADAKGLMAAAIRDDNPVLYFEPMSLSHGPREDVPDGEYQVDIGAARVARPGKDVSVVALGSMVSLVLHAAASVARDGIDAEVIDLRSLRPWDERTVFESVARTGCLLTVHEAWTAGGFGAEVVARVVEELGANGSQAALKVARVGALPVPTPSGGPRASALPSQSQVELALRRLVSTIS